MSKLDEARLKINQIDEEMIKLFKERMEAVKMVAEYKIENNMDVLDSSREAELKKKNLAILNNEELAKYYLTFLDGVLTSSKDMQKDLIKKC